MTSPSPGTIVDGRYRLVRLSGQGAMSSVFAAEHVFTGDRVAVKLLAASSLTDEAIARLRREARVLASIRSPHATRIVDAGVTPGDDGASAVPFLVMELLEGESLAERVARGGAQAPADVARWIGEAADALAEAHAAGIVHRDVKPGNVFLARTASGDASVRVLDFGVAQVVDATSHTVPGMLLGTPRYMAPEQARSSGAPVGPAADVYALGMLAFTLLAGVPYRRGASMEQVLTEAILEPVVAPSMRGLDYGPAFDAWFLKACASAPEARFPGVSAQARALAAALDGAVRRIQSPDVTADAVAPRLSTADAGTVREVQPMVTHGASARARPPHAGRRAWLPGLVALGVMGAAAAFALRPAPPAEGRAAATSAGTPVPLLSTPGAPEVPTRPAAPASASSPADGAVSAPPGSAPARSLPAAVAGASTASGRPTLASPARQGAAPARPPAALPDASKGGADPFAGNRY